MIIALVGAYIAYIIFGIIYLWRYKQLYHSSHVCDHKQYIWEYCITAIIISILSIVNNYKTTNSNNNNDNNDNNIAAYICACICYGLIKLSLAIWGAIEIYENTCYQLKHNNLFIFAQVTFYMQLSCAIIALVILPIIFTCVFYISKKKEANQRNTNDIVIV